MKKLVLGFSSAAIGLALLVAPAFASGTVVYNALPSVDPATSYPSQPFQAQQTFEFGDQIHLGGTARDLNTVTVTFVTWAPYSQWSSDPRYTDSTHWTHPITLNVYGTHLNGNGAPDNLLATTTQSISIPWRPAGDPSCPVYTPGGPNGWKDGSGNCHFGYAFNATFDLSGSHVTLPDDVIVSVAFNTETWGVTPIGVDGPYDSLNIAVPPSQPVTVGSDANTDAVFWNTHTCSDYTDPTSKATCTGGTYGLFEDTGWTPYGTVALQVTANLPTPTNKDQCKNNGWKNYADENGNPFKNQGDCVSYVATRYKSFTASDSLYYNCPSVCDNLYGTGAISFTWDKATGNVISGYYNEVVPPTSGTTYYNIVTSGTVSGNNVTLTFTRTNPNAYGPFNFTGTLVNGVLSGTLDGPYYFTATGN